MDGGPVERQVFPRTIEMQVVGPNGCMRFDPGQFAVPPFGLGSVYLLKHGPMNKVAFGELAEFERNDRAELCSPAISADEPGQKRLTFLKSGILASYGSSARPITVSTYRNLQ